MQGQVQGQGHGQVQGQGHGQVQDQKLMKVWDLTPSSIALGSPVFRGVGQVQGQVQGQVPDQVQGQEQQITKLWDLTPRSTALGSTVLSHTDEMDLEGGLPGHRLSGQVWPGQLRPSLSHWIVTKWGP